MAEHKARRFDLSIRAVIQNAERLLDDAQFLEFSEPPTSAWFLALIAQEELAKAFMLCLIDRSIIPWNSHIVRAMQDHKCKQLICVVMDYLAPDTEEFLSRINTVVLKRQLPQMPRKVADALNILRHEKIGRWVSQSWFWAEDPHYDDEAQAIAEGKKDRLKQDAVYVRLSRDGGVASTPVNHRHVQLPEQMERARRFKSLVENLVQGTEHPGLDWHDVEEAFKMLFTDIAEAR